ncbi:MULTISPECIES: hypothetical protein [unclassified Campylobacter]|nr:MULTISPECIES: hypothetical protein [unclassified Campylobacter]MDA3079682.1 hypothetical protein [Campylobacter sp. CS_NA2]MDA3080886.1 hypothetical protein [Campylobacter sp. CS_NA1]MDA3085437.1 hypothetical protein [Campylobacter sp. CS_ED1]MDA3090514.1 hypothetical protein [Campylobacter sp. CS_ED2]WBR50704.1 hypothetical protein PF026_04945 [Campylobacter sp. CS_NA3]
MQTLGKIRLICIINLKTNADDFVCGEHKIRLGASIGVRYTRKLG